MTPEGLVKKEINKILDMFPLYRFMPVPSGYGQSSLDYLVCAKGTFVAIEAKKPKGTPTPRQRAQLREIEQAGGDTFVIDSVQMARDVLVPYFKRIFP